MFFITLQSGYKYQPNDYRNGNSKPTEEAGFASLLEDIYYPSNDKTNEKSKYD